MIDRRAATLLLKRMLYIGIGLIIIFYQLLPLKTTPPTWVGPDLLMAITIVYAIRRPAYIPIGSVALLFLFSDFKGNAITSVHWSIEKNCFFKSLT